MAIHAYIGFLEIESALKGVDDDFRELARSAYKIPGFGTHGVSCSGHFDPVDDYGRFYPKPWGHLGFAVLPELEHMPELLQLIYATTQTDPDAWVGIEENKPPVQYDRFRPGVDLRPYSTARTKNGLYVARLEVRISDNGCLDSVPNHLCSPVELEGNEEAFEKSRQRCSQIKGFWKRLEDEVEAYNKKHGFSESGLDFHKSEFEPFR